jgi:hypothetical protein
VQEEVHVEEPENDPVVEAVLQEVEDGHGIVGEAMHEKCLKLTLYIVAEYQGKANLLIHGQRLLCLVDLLPESQKDRADN